VNGTNFTGGNAARPGPGSAIREGGPRPGQASPSRGHYEILLINCAIQNGQALSNEVFFSADLGYLGVLGDRPFPGCWIAKK